MSHRQVDSATTFVGLDVHKNSITSAVLVPGAETPVVDRIFPDEASIKRLVGGLGDPKSLAVCYEAGPTGYDLARLLERMGVACEVIAPSLIPMPAGARVKTDRRDARRLALLFRARQLTRGAHPDRGRRGRPGPVPGQGRHGDRPHPGPPPSGQVPLRHNVVSGETDRTGRCATRPGWPRCGSATTALTPHLRPLPARCSAPSTPSWPPSRPTSGATWATGPSPRRCARLSCLPGRDRARGAHAGRRGGRLGAGSRGPARSWGSAG